MGLEPQGTRTTYPLEITGWEVVPIRLNIDRDSFAPFEKYMSSERALPSLALAFNEDLGRGMWGEEVERKGNRREMKSKREQNKAREKKSMSACKQVGAVVVMNIYRVAI